MEMQHVLKAENISKSFPGVLALEGVSLHVERGKVLAITGENGAGKSTLMKVLMGMHAPDSGQIYLNGRMVRFNSIQDAIKAGFSMIHQELNVFPELTVAENIFIGKEPATGMAGWINRRKTNQDAAMLLRKLGVDINVTLKMKALRIAEMQMVEIAKAISNKAQVIFMDEPTSALSAREVGILFNIIKELTQQGIAIVYISHKMDEILKISDRIMVMRDGKLIASRLSAGLDYDQLIFWIVGREIDQIYGKKQVQPGEIILSVKGLTGKKFYDISFTLRKGEILGIAGLMGSGRTEMVHAIYGLEKIYGGDIEVNGRPVRIGSPRNAIDAGISLVGEDRKLHGLVLSSSIKKNITLSSLDKWSNGIFPDAKKENKVVDAQIKNLNIKVRSKNQPAGLLSGGNQQKIVIAKAILNDSDIIILDEPTRGIDIGAKIEIYHLMHELASHGKAILMISSELPEILGLSDRILVVHEGKLKAELPGTQATQELIMKHIMS